MKQILFVLKEGQIAFWKYSRGSLARGTLNGNRWNEYTPSFWNEWCEVNQPDELEDAILLSDTPSGFGELPTWLKGEGKEPSEWSVDTLAKLANDSDYEGKGLEIHQGKTKYALSMGSTVDVYSLASSLKFVLPKEAPKPVEPEPPKPIVKTSDIIGDNYNDPEALNLAVGEERKGVIVSIFKVMKRNYVEVDGLKEQVCFKANDKTNFDIGDTVTLTVTKVDEAAKKVLFAIAKG